MERGEIWTMAGGPHYTSKPRPVVVLQNDLFADLDSITVCSLTSQDIGVAPFRIPVFPTADNGLRLPSWLMADKTSSAPRTKLGSRVGRLDRATLAELSRAVIVFLHLDAGRPSATRSRR